MICAHSLMGFSCGRVGQSAEYWISRLTQGELRNMRCLSRLAAPSMTCMEPANECRRETMCRVAGGRAVQRPAFAPQSHERARAYGPAQGGGSGSDRA